MGPRSRRSGPQERRVKTSLSSGASSGPQSGFSTAAALEPVAEAPGRRPCCPTHSHPHPRSSKQDIPSLAWTGALKSRGLARSPGVSCVQSLVFTEGNCGPEKRGGLSGSQATQDGGSTWTQRWALLRTAPGSVLGGSEAHYPFSSPMLKIRPPHPRPGWRPGPSSGKVTLESRGPWRGRKRRRAKIYGAEHAQRPRDSGGCESTLGAPERQKLGDTVRRSQVAGNCSGPGPGQSGVRPPHESTVRPWGKGGPGSCPPQGLSGGRGQTKS